MVDIVFEFDVNAPPDKVYKAVTEEAGYKGWWTTSSAIKPQVGSKAEFKLKDNGQEVVFQTEVTQLEKDKSFAMTVKNAAPPDWPGTKIAVSMAPSPQGTHVVFSHSGFPSTGGSYGYTNYNWGFFMGSLKAFAETGKGMPYQYQ